jgi:hypothetical protein
MRMALLHCSAFSGGSVSSAQHTGSAVVVLLLPLLQLYTLLPSSFVTVAGNLTHWAF